ncbi:MAG: ssl1498 family light-harvesting-like protein [Cyanobacteria bacterium P01_F01_bin.150]
MPYTTEEGGLLNNFAVEPKMYQAEAPTSSDKRNYIILGLGSILLLGGLLAVAVTVS